MKIIVFVVLICIVVLNILFAQNSFQNPESIAFSSENNLYYISNYGSGRVVVVDEIYTIIDTLVSGLSGCMGIHLIENILYVSCNNRLKGFDIETGDCIFNLLLPVENWLDGINSDVSGNLYVVDTSGRIFMINISNQSYSIIADTFPNYTQDIEFDEANNRLLVVAWSNNSPIYFLNLLDYSTGEIYGTNIGYFDGISMDDEGNVYVSSHTNSGSVFKFESTLTEDPFEIEGDFNEPAGLHCNSFNDILAVPNFAGNSVEFIDISGTQSVNKTLEKLLQNEVNNYPNPFNPTTTIYFELNTKINEEIKLIIYNIRGQRIKSFCLNNVKPQTQYQITWDGTDNMNKSVSSGLYFYKLKANNFEKTAKMSLIK